jgi:putative protease
MREQLGRLGDTPFALGALNMQGLADGLFLPVSELNRLRQDAVEQLGQFAGWDHDAQMHERRERIGNAVSAASGSAASDLVIDSGSGSSPEPSAASVELTSTRYQLAAHVFRIEDAEAAAAAGATEIVLDPFLRHPIPPVSRVRALGERLAEAGVTLRLRTPTIVRPEDRKTLDKWLALGLPILSGHLGLIAELASAGTDVVADYAVNCFNQHTAAELFRLGAKQIVPSIELTTEEIAQLVAPWGGAGFNIFVYGRPEGMTIEHCVLSAAFDRVATTCRDLCVQKHTNVALTDPTGYTFAVATDSDCRNRLLHSRPVEGSEYLPRLWQHGLRSFHAVFNVLGDDVASVITGYKEMLDALAAGTQPSANPVRQLVGSTFTRGHFARAV